MVVIAPAVYSGVVAAKKGQAQVRPWLQGVLCNPQAQASVDEYQRQSQPIAGGSDQQCQLTSIL